jgi:hypothetical protein
VSVVSLAGRRAAGGRPQAGLELVEKLLLTNLTSTKLTSTDTTERNAGMLRVPLAASTGRPGYWLELLVALVVIAVTHRRPVRLLGQHLDYGPGVTILGRVLVPEVVHLALWLRGGRLLSIFRGPAGPGTPQLSHQRCCCPDDGRRADPYGGHLSRCSAGESGSFQSSSARCSSVRPACPSSTTLRPGGPPRTEFDLIGAGDVENRLAAVIFL